MAVGTTNRITLRIGVVFDKAGLDAQAKNVQRDLDGKLADSTKQQTKALKDQQKALTKRTGEMKKEKTILAELTTGWNKMVSNFLKFTVVASITMALTVSLKQMKDLIFELDTAMTNLSIVTGATASELAMVDTQATKLTTSLGALKGEVINSVTEFARAGFSLSDALLLTERATMAANVGFTELDRITTFLIAGLKSFKLEAEDSARVLDVLFRVANVTAIDLEGIGEAFLRSANTLKVAGATLEESASLIAAANESIQDPAKVGTALKTIASRLRGIGDEGEVVPTLAKDFKAVGIEIQNADGSFRNIYDVFQEFAEVYKTLDDLTKESLLEKLAGKRQKNIMIGLLENFDVAQMALEEAMNSAGAVAEANEKYLDSLEGKTKILTETWGELLRKIGDSSALKTAIDLFTDILRLLTKTTSGIGALILSLGSLTVAVGTFGLIATGGISALIPIIASAVSLFSGFNFLTSATTSEFEKLNTELNKTNVKISELNSGIEKLRSKKDITESEQRYLEQLQEQLRLEEEIANVQSERIAELEFQKTKASIDEVTEALEELREIQEGTAETFRKGGKEYTVAPNSDRDLEQLDKLQTKLIAMRNELVLASIDLDSNSAAYEFNQLSIEAVDKALLETTSLYGMLGVEINKATEVTYKNTKSFQNLSTTLQSVKSLVASASEDYQILSDALFMLEDQGYLTDDMLNTLLLTYPNIIAETGLVADAVRDYANAERESTNSIIDSKIRLLEVQKSTFEEQIKLYEQSMKLLAYDSGTNDELMYAAQFALSSGVVGQARAAVRNAENAIASLQNEKLIISGIDRNRQDAINKSTKSTIDEKEALSELERQLRDVTQAISVLEREYARAEGANEQIRINDDLIAQYKLQKSTLESLRDELKLNNKEIKIGDEGYDEYIDQLYSFSLQIEDATNAIFKLTSANSDMRKVMTQSVNDLRELMTKMIEQELKNEISKHKELIDLAKEQLDIKLKQLDAEKDLADFSKSRLNKEKSLSKIISKMDSLRAAASQGDMRAINELNQLEEERIKTQEEIDSLINDRSFELRKENLQNQFDEFEATQQKEIDEFEKNLNDASYIAQKANDYMIAYLSGNMDSLYQSLVDWNAVYGTGVESDVISKWEKAISLIREFNSLSASGGSGFNFEDYGQQMSYKDSVVEAMRKNRQLWLTADEETRKALNQKNIELAKTIGYSYRDDGNYYSDKDGSKLIFDNGGFKPKGVAGYMAEGVEEWVLKDGQIQAMQEMAIESMLNRIGLRSPSLSNASGNIGDVNIYIESVTDNNVARIERSIKETVKEVSQGQLDAFKSRGYVPSIKIR